MTAPTEHAASIVKALRYESRAIGGGTLAVVELDGSFVVALAALIEAFMAERSACDVLDAMAADESEYAWLRCKRATDARLAEAAKAVSE